MVVQVEPAPDTVTATSLPAPSIVLLKPVNTVTPPLSVSVPALTLVAPLTLRVLLPVMPTVSLTVRLAIVASTSRTVLVWLPAPVAEKVMSSALVGVAVMAFPAALLAQLASLQFTPVWPSQWVAASAASAIFTSPFVFSPLRSHLNLVSRFEVTLKFETSKEKMLKSMILKLCPTVPV